MTWPQGNFGARPSAAPAVVEIEALAEGDGHELLHHLMVDYLVKGAIVVAALAALVFGMVLIWKKTR